MLRTLLILVLTSAPAYAGEPYCSDEMPFTAITPSDDDYVLTEGYHQYTCEPRDERWHKCDNRDDYLVHFERRGDEIWISQPTYPEGKFTKFALCQ
jgi:hypothetical protein